LQRQIQQKPGFIVGPMCAVFCHLLAHAMANVICGFAYKW
jgi:hypothetical protein